MRRPALLIIVLAQLWVGLCSHGNAVDAPELERALGEGAATPLYDKVLSKVVSIYKLNDLVHVGPGGRADQLSLFVLSDDYKGTDAAALRKNAIAVRPRTIVIGERFLATVMIDAVNALTVAVDIGQMYALDPEVAEIYARNSTGPRRMHLLRDLRLGDGEPSTVSIARAMMEGQPDLNGLPEENVLMVLAGALAHPILHEVGHLSKFESNPADAAGLFEFVTDWLEQLRAEKIFAEEAEADRLALANIVTAIETLEGVDRELFAMGAESYAYVMRDIVIANVFDDIRGMFAEDFFVRMQHIPCEYDPSLTALDFTALARLISAEDLGMPPLTREEFSLVRERLKSADPYNTHPHNFQRALLILDILKQRFNYKPLLSLSQNMALLKSVNEGVNRLVDEFADREPLPWSPEEIMTRLSSSYDFERADLCPGKACWIGQPEGTGFLELVESKRGLGRIRFAVPFGRLSLEDTSKLEEYTLSSILSIEFLIEGLKLDEQTYFMLGEARKEYLRCGIGDFLLDMGNYRIQVSSTINDNFIVYDVEPW